MVPRASHCEHCFIREYYWRRGPLGGFQLIDGCAASLLSCGFLLEQIPLLFQVRREQSPQFGELRGQSLLRCLGLPFVGAVTFPRDDGGGGVRFSTSAVGVQARPPSRIQRASAFTIDSSFLGSESAMTDERLSGKPSWGHLASVQGHSGALGRLGALSRSTQVAMAVAGSLAVPRGSPDHLAALLPVSRGRAQVPVDQKPGSRVRSLQFPHQGAVLPGRVFRAHEGRKNSRTMLLPLLQKFPEQVRVSLFHTPNLRGLLRLFIPERFNETIGLQHIKVYLFDNSVILSGANLSDSYFTNRQDRYVFLQDCADVADFFTELVEAVGDVSLQLQGDDTVQVVDGMVHPYKGDRAAYCKAANERVMGVINSARARQQQLHAQTFHGDPLLTQDAAAAGDRRPAPDTWIYPLVQMKPFEIQIDEIVTETLLTEAERGARVYLTTGYFNLTQAYMDLVLGTRAEYQILLASPEVNGFFGAKGVAGAIPAAYVHIERQFYSEVCGLGQQERVQLQEYWRRGWTFHAKGLWLYLAGSSLPCLTLIGSPNFGYRSVHRDLEAQIAIVTESRALQQQLHQEAGADGHQGVLRPLVEPVDGRAVDHGRELPRSHAQDGAHGGEAQDHLGAVTDELLGGGRQRGGQSSTPAGRPPPATPGRAEGASVLGR
uniref:CDP-diacylglycerol--glycerol-3-phosphate 3-phosphatidyltransferase n=1 Tax=Oryctolagus cuniculus TaxID=9986 RepID=A0A5F9CN87_RABIT